MSARLGKEPNSQRVEQPESREKHDDDDEQVRPETEVSVHRGLHFPDPHVRLSKFADLRARQLETGVEHFRVEPLSIRRNLRGQLRESTGELTREFAVD